MAGAGALVLAAHGCREVVVAAQTVRPGVHDRGVEAAVAISAGDRAQPAIAELRSGQRFEGRYACVRKDRLTARNGGAYLSLELRDDGASVALPAAGFALLTCEIE